MSPEQARGKPLDRRTDIWSCGCVLFECLTGRPAFQGDTVSDLVGAILRSEPDWSLLPAATPARLRELLARCLRKDARSRLRDIGDARVTLEELGGAIPAPEMESLADCAPTALPPLSGRRLWPWAVAAAFVLGIVSTALWRRGDAPPTVASPLHIAMAAPGLDADAFSGPALSLDGRHVAYASRGQLWVRSLERFEDRVVPGSDGVGGMFWSPRSDVVGFARDRHLWLWLLGSSESRMLCALPGSGEMNGAVWMPDGKIYFCLYRGGLFAVPASGGEPEMVLDRAAGEFDFHQPAMLPGGREFVAVAHRDSGAQQVFAFTCAKSERHPVLEMAELSTAAYSPAGYLLLCRNWTTQDLWAVRFSPNTRRIAGDPFPVESGAQGPSIAADGAMIYYQGDRASLYDLVWVARDGSWEMVPGGPFQGLNEPAVSPDGRRIAFSGVKDDNRDIWVLDLERGTRTRLTSDPANDFSPRWSRDGRTIFYRVWVPGIDHLWRVAADGGADPEFLVDGAGIEPLPDGQAIVFAAPGADRRDANLYRKPLARGGEVSPLVATAFDEDQPAVSPDG
jgi:serine/threonine-protein kinase